MTMRFKLDVNLSESVARIFREAGHDVETVFSQGLCSSSDQHLMTICAKENRCLVTLDMDFSNPLLFNPTDYSGIAVLRVPSPCTLKDIQQAVITLLLGLQRDSIEGSLWIVQRGRIRIYQPEGNIGD